MEVIDKYGRYHDKPCINLEPKSNNGWIYTAYADKLGLEINWFKLELCYKLCLVDGKFRLRSPGKELPPVSHDEILGAAALDLLKPQHLQGWSFSPKPIPKFNLFRLASQIWELRPSIVSDGTGGYEVQFKHRNYFWENNLDQIYRFAYSVPLSHRHFIQEKWGDFNPIYWAIAKVDSWFPKKSGIRWLKYGKSLEAMQEEFPAQHPFRG